jgi:putative Mn2+ efflux pump MntP
MYCRGIQFFFLAIYQANAFIAFVFPLGNDMMQRDNKKEKNNNNNNRRHHLIAATTIFLLAIAIMVGASTSIATTQ